VIRERYVDMLIAPFLSLAKRSDSSAFEVSTCSSISSPYGFHDGCPKEAFLEGTASLDL
jgi:hypothetical protein